MMYSNASLAAKPVARVWYVLFLQHQSSTDAQSEAMLQC